MRSVTDIVRNPVLFLAVGLVACCIALSASFAERAWADAADPCGYAYLMRNDDASDTFTLILKKEQVNDGESYRALGPVATDAHNAVDYGWRDSIPDWGKVRKVSIEGGVNPTSTVQWFSGFTGLTEVDLSGLDATNLTEMGGMFAGCTSLEEMSFPEHFASGRVTATTQMFERCKSLKKVDFSNFDATSLTNISHMFYGCAFTDPAEVMRGLDTSHVTNMYMLFSSNDSLSSADLSGFNLANVENMGSMFDFCPSLSEVCFPDGPDGKLSKVRQTDDMFRGCYSLTSIDLSAFSEAPLVHIGSMFSDCTGLTELDLSQLDLSHVVYMWTVFRNCSNVTEIRLPNAVKVTSSATDMRGLFQSCSSLKQVNLSALDTSKTKDLSAMFSGCAALEEIDVSGFDTASATTLSGMFGGCSSLEAIDLSGSDFSSATSFSGMFSGCSSLKTVNFSGVASPSGEISPSEQVLSCDSMFARCASFESADLSWLAGSGRTLGLTNAFLDCEALSNVSCGGEEVRVSHIDGLFSGCSSLKSVDLSGFQTAALLDECGGETVYHETALCPSGLQEVKLGSGFDKAQALDGLFTIASAWAPDAEGEDACSSSAQMLECVNRAGEAVTFSAQGEPQGTFAYADESTQTLVLTPSRHEAGDGERVFGFACNGVVPWQPYCTSFKRVKIEQGVKPDSTARWFRGFENLTSIDGLRNLDTSSVTDMSRMFDGCSSLESLDVSGFDTSNVTDMSRMFASCGAFSKLDVSRLNTPSVTDMSRMFADCSSLESINLSGFNTEKVRSMHDMFCNCTTLAELDLTSFDTGSVTDMSSMFASCWALSSVKLSSFNTSNVTDMSFMFNTCKSLESIDVSSFNTQNAERMTSMFADCVSLKELDLSSFSIPWQSGEGTALWMLSGCTSLTRVKATAHVEQSLGLPDGAWCIKETGEYCRNILAGMDATYGRMSQESYCYAVLSEGGTLTLDYNQPEPSESGEVYVVLFEGYDSAAAVPWHARANEVKSVVVTKNSDWWKAIKPQSTAHWFEGCTSLTAVDLTGLDSSETVDFSGMFYGCTSLESLNLSAFNTRNAESMKRMLHGCTALGSVTLGGDFTFRGAAWSRLAGSELPSGAWQKVDAEGNPVEGKKAYASDSLPSFTPATYRKVAEESLSSYTVESVRGDAEGSAEKYTVETTLSDDGAGGYVAESTYAIDDAYASDELVIGEASKASSALPTVTAKTVTAQTLKGVKANSSKVHTVVVGPQVSSISAYAFKSCPGVSTVQVRSARLTTQKSVAKCLAQSGVRNVYLPTRYLAKSAKAKVKSAFVKWSKPKYKCKIY